MEDKKTAENVAEILNLNWKKIDILGTRGDRVPVSIPLPIPKYNSYVFAPRPLFSKYMIPSFQHPLSMQLKNEEEYLLVFGIQPVMDFVQD
jgi:hypothetical protein